MKKTINDNKYWDINVFSIADKWCFEIVYKLDGEFYKQFDSLEAGEIYHTEIQARDAGKQKLSDLILGVITSRKVIK